MLVSSAWISNEDSRSEYRVIPALSHSLGAAALNFWNERGQDGIVIGRDVPSRAIAKLLSRVLVYRPIDGGRDLKVHLAGTSIRRRFGRDVTGSRMSELFLPHEFPIRFKTMMEALEHDEPRMAGISHRAGSVEILKLEILMLPAYAPDQSEKWPLVFSFYF